MKHLAIFAGTALLLTACPGTQPSPPVTGPGQPEAAAGGTEVAVPDDSAGEGVRTFLKVHLVNVGQADGVIVECPNHEVGMVIDSADSRDKSGMEAFEVYLSKLMEKDKDKTIPLVVATHPHSDHIGHLKWVVETYGIGVYVDNGQKHTSKVYRDLMTVVKNKEALGMPHMSIDITPTPKPWNICDGDMEALVTALVPSGGFQGCKSSPNECSLVLRMDYGKTSYLFAGDAEHDEEAELLADSAVGPVLKADVLKAGHHGSDTSSTWEWMEKVMPSCVLVSAGQEGKGTNKRYKHPRASTLENFNEILQQVRPDMGWRDKAVRAYDKDKEGWVDFKVRAGVSLTPLDGDIVSKTDGETVTCR